MVPRGVFFCFRIIVELALWTLWWGVSPYRVYLEWSKTGSNRFSPECMDRLRIDLDNPFGKSLDR